MARHFQHKIEVYFKEMVLDGPLGETKCYVCVMNFRKWVAPMFIHSLGFSKYQIFTIRRPILNPLKIQAIINALKKNKHS